MPDTTTAPGAQAPDRQALDAAAARGRDDGIKAGCAEERARITAIVRSDEAEDRAGTALAMALDTDMTADEARKVLAATPKAAAAAGNRPGEAFYQAVAATAGNPQERAARLGLRVVRE